MKGGGSSTISCERGRFLVKFVKRDGLSTAGKNEEILDQLLIKGGDVLSLYTDGGPLLTKGQKRFLINCRLS